MRTAALALTTALALAAAGRAAPPADWESWATGSATAVLVIDAQALNNSPLAAREGWAKRRAAGTPLDVTSLPPGTTSLLIASDLSPSTLDATWRVAILDLGRPVTAAEIVRQSGGRLDTVRGQQVVVTPRDVVIVPAGPSRLVARQPAERQALSRWLGQQQSKAGAPSAYLRQAVATARAPVVAAFDMTDATDAASLRPRLQGCTALAGKSAAELDAAANLLAGLKGVTLSARVTDAIEGEARLDFGASPAALQPILLPLVQEALKGAGAELDDLTSWSVRIDGNSAVLHGRLSEESLRLAFSPFFPPAAASAAAPPPESPGQDPKLAASLDYYRGLANLTDQLRHMKGLTMQTRTRWYNEYARKIDALPVLHVDPELLQLGANVAATLRAMAVSSTTFNAQGQLIENQRASGQAYLGYNNTVVAGGYNRWGNAVGVGYSAPATAYTNNYSQVNTYLAANESTEGKLRVQTWKNINDAIADMRKKMTLKYQVEFTTGSQLQSDR